MAVSLTEKCCILLVVFGVELALALRKSVTDLNSCEQCFGFGGGIKTQTAEIQQPLSPKAFFRNYVDAENQKPVIMRGLMKDSDAYKNWQTDEYLMSLDVPPESKQRVEINKVQDSRRPNVEMNFLDFVEIYKELPYYMVDTLPEFMRQDITLPWCLQCDVIKKEILTDLVLWFSSGGTNGYIHTDQVHNVHCVYSGSKYFIIIPPKYMNKIKFEKPISTTSKIDVNHVGYDTRPELLEVEYYHANVSEGDCVYIPFDWIHQVRSFGERHIAVSIWWDYFNDSSRVDVDKCNEKMDPTWKLSDMKLHKDDVYSYVGTIKYGVLRCVDNAVEQGLQGMDLSHFARLVFQEISSELDEIAGLLTKPLPSIKKIFNLIDRDKNGLVTREESNKVSNEEWTTVRDLWGEMEDSLVSHGDAYSEDGEWWNGQGPLRSHPTPEVDSIKDEL